MKRKLRMYATRWLAVAAIAVVTPVVAHQQCPEIVAGAALRSSYMVGPLGDTLRPYATSWEGTIISANEERADKVLYSSYDSTTKATDKQALVVLLLLFVGFGSYFMLYLLPIIWFLKWLFPSSRSKSRKQPETSKTSQELKVDNKVKKPKNPKETDHPEPTYKSDIRPLIKRIKPWVPDIKDKQLRRSLERSLEDTKRYFKEYYNDDEDILNEFRNALNCLLGVVIEFGSVCRHPEDNQRSSTVTEQSIRAINHYAGYVKGVILQSNEADFPAFEEDVDGLIHITGPQDAPRSNE